MEVIFGLDCVKAALSSNRRQIYKLLAYHNKDTMKSEGSEVLRIIESAQQRRIPVQFTTRSELDSLLEKRPHQNVALSVSKFEPPVLPEPPSLSTHNNNITVFPVNILDPQNLGSIIRTAAFYSCAGLVTSLKDSCDFTPIVSKASAGCMEVFENIYRTKSVLQFLTKAKLNGFKIVGTGLNCMEAETEDFPVSPQSKLILLLGNEGRGLSPQVLDLCDYNMKIEQNQQSFPHLDSLNVSVATGILLDRLVKSKSEALKL